MKKRLNILLVILSIVVFGLGGTYYGLDFMKDLKIKKELVSGLEEQNAIMQQKKDELDAKNQNAAGSGQENINHSDKLVITQKILAHSSAMLKSIDVYSSSADKQVKLASLENQMDVQNLNKDANVLVYKVETTDVDAYLEYLSTLPVVYNDVIVLPLSMQILITVNFS